MSDIYYGRIEHPWAMDVENWTEMSQLEEQRLKDYKESIVQHTKYLDVFKAKVCKLSSFLFCY